MPRPTPHELLCIAVTGTALALPASPAHAVDFYKDVFPFLEANCVACHNKTSTKGGLNLETPADLRRGGDSGPGALPGKSKESPVVRSASHAGEEVMPPKNNKSGARDLTPEEIRRLSAWIDAGAKDSEKPVREIVWKPQPAGVSPIYSVALSPDGRTAVCARGNRLFAYDTDTRTQGDAPADPSTGAPGRAHLAAVHSCAFNPDGTRLATGSFREVKIWSRASAPQRASRVEGTDLLTLLTSGTGAVCIDQNRLPKLRPLESAAPERALGAPLPAKALLAVPSPDDTRIAFLLENGSVHVRSTRQDLPDFHLDAPQTDAPAPATTATTATTAARPAQLTWSGDSRTLILADSQGGVRLQPLPDAGAPQPQPSLSFTIPGGIHALAPLQGDAFALLAKDATLRLYRTHSTEPTASLKAPNALGLALSADASRAALALDSGKVRILELPGGTPIAELGGDPAATLQIEALERRSARASLEIAFQKSVLTKLESELKNLETHTKRTGELIATAKKTLPEREKAVPPAKTALEAAQKELETLEGTLQAAPEGKPDPASANKRREALNKVDAARKAFISAETLVNGAKNQITDGEAHLAHVEASQKRNADEAAKAAEAVKQAEDARASATKELAALQESAGKGRAPALHMAFSADNARVYAVDASGLVRAWAVASARPTGMQRPPANAAPTALRFAHGRSLCALSDGSLLHGEGAPVWKLERTLGGPKDSLFAERINALRFSPDGRLLAAGGGEFSRSGDVHLFDAATGKQVALWKEKHRDAVLALDFSPDGKWLVSGGADRLARVTEVATGRQVYSLEAHTHQVTAVAFRVDGRVVATGGADGVVNVWDMDLGERKKKLTSWKKEITSLQFLGSTNQVLTSSGDNQVRIVTDDAAEVKALQNLPDFMQAAAGYSPNGFIIAGGEDSFLRIWEVPSGKELAAFPPQDPPPSPLNKPSTPDSHVRPFFPSLLSRPFGPPGIHALRPHGAGEPRTSGTLPPPRIHHNPGRHRFAQFHHPGLATRRLLPRGYLRSQARSGQRVSQPLQHHLHQGPRHAHHRTSAPAGQNRGPIHHRSLHAPNRRRAPCRFHADALRRQGHPRQTQTPTPGLDVRRLLPALQTGRPRQSPPQLRHRQPGP